MTIQNRSIGFVALLSTVILSASAAVTPITFQPESRLAIAQLQKAVRTVEVSVPVQSLDCGNGTMNCHLRNALRMEANPTIEFRSRSTTSSPAVRPKAPSG